MRGKFFSSSSPLYYKATQEPSSKGGKHFQFYDKRLGLNGLETPTLSPRGTWGSGQGFPPRLAFGLGSRLRPRGLRLICRLPISAKSPSCSLQPRPDSLENSSVAACPLLSYLGLSPLPFYEEKEGNASGGRKKGELEERWSGPVGVNDRGPGPS
jgi:hypothetical protein